MNRTDYTQTGGHPLQLNDLDWSQAGLSEAIGHLAGSLRPGQNYILFGCEASTTPSGAGYELTLTPGAVVIDGEVCTVNAQTLTLNDVDDDLWFTIESTFVAPSPVTYNSGQPKSVHEQRIAVLQTGQRPLGIPDLKTYPTTAEAIETLLYNDPWHQVGAAGEPAYNTGWAGSAGFGLQFRKIPGKRVQLRGTVGTSINALSSVCTLPVGYRPAHPRRLTIPAIVQNLGRDILLTIASSGAILLSDDVSVLPGDYYLDGVTFSL